MLRQARDFKWSHAPSGRPKTGNGIRRAGKSSRRRSSVVESFLRIAEKECLGRRVFATRTEAYDAVASYVDGFYNLVRRHSARGYANHPIEYEQHHRA
jgi:putative transposase